MDRKELKEDVREGSEDFIKQLRLVILMAEMEQTGLGEVLIEVLHEELNHIAQNLPRKQANIS